MPAAVCTTVTLVLCLCWVHAGWPFCQPGGAMLWHIHPLKRMSAGLSQGMPVLPADTQWRHSVTGRDVPNVATCQKTQSNLACRTFIKLQQLGCRFGGGDEGQWPGPHAAGCRHCCRRSGQPWQPNSGHSLQGPAQRPHHPPGPVSCGNCMPDVPAVCSSRLYSIETLLRIINNWLPLFAAS